MTGSKDVTKKKICEIQNFEDTKTTQNKSNEELCHYTNIYGDDFVERTEYIMTQSDNRLVKDITLNWLYTPHSLIALFFVIASLLYFGFTRNSSVSSMSDNFLTGLGVAVFVFLVIGLLVFPSGPFIRPHPLVWRFVFGCSLVYLMGLIVLFFQNADDARRLLKLFDSSLGVPLIERSYAEQCDLNQKNFLNALNDRYVLSHFFGQIGKAILIRDRMVCQCASITWELIEYSTIFAFPNFAECWQDSQILDVMLANGLGIEIGIYLCKLLEVKKYYQSGIWQVPTIQGKIRRSILQFSPESWTVVRQEKSSSIKRFFGVFVVIFMMSLAEMNAFSLKSVLWVNSESNLNIYRLFLQFFIGLPSIRQYYVYLVDPRCKRLGTQAIVVICINFVEVLIFIKFGLASKIFSIPIPKSSIRMQISLLIFYSSMCILLLLKLKTKKQDIMMEKKTEFGKSSRITKNSEDESDLLISSGSHQTNFDTDDKFFNLQSDNIKYRLRNSRIES